MIFIFDCITIVAVFLRALIIGSQSKYFAPIYDPNTYTVTCGAFAYEQLILLMLAFMINLVLAVLVFSISMMRFRRQEKKSSQEQEN